LKGIRQAAQGKGDSHSDLAALEKLEDLGDEAGKKVNPLDDPALLPAKEFRDRGRCEPLALGQVVYQDGLVVIGKRSLPAVEFEHHGLGCEEVPFVLYDGRDGSHALSLEGQKAFEAIHDLEAVVFSGNDGDGLCRMAAKRCFAVSLEIGQICPDLVYRNIGQFHDGSPPVVNRV